MLLTLLINNRHPEGYVSTNIAFNIVRRQDLN